MNDPVTQSLDPRLLNNLQLQQVLKDCYDSSVKAYVDNGLLPQSLADEMIHNMTGADVLKWVMQQTVDSPYIRTPTGIQFAAQRDLPPFHDNRPDCLDARICALRYSDEPVIRRDSFIKIIPSEK